MGKYFTCITLLLCSLISRGSIVEIRYHVPEANQATLCWGVNDWKIITEQPAGTIIKDNVMRSPMIREGEDYVLKITLPDSCTLDYFFRFKKTAGPFKINFGYLDINEQGDKKFYHNVVKANMIIKISPDLTKLKPDKNISLIKYSALFFFIFLIFSILLFTGKKIIFKTQGAPLRSTSLFFSIPLTLLCILVIIRAIVTGMAVEFLIAPLPSVPLLFKTSYHDFLYTAFLTMLFGIFFYVKKNWRLFTLYLFGSIAILSILICMLNIKITELLGRPFTYQWLYYSDFLTSTDASRAISANIENQSLAAYLLMMLTAVPLVWLIYQLLINKPILTFAILIMCFGIGYFAKDNFSINDEKRENPITYFISSLTQQNGFGLLSVNDRGDQNEFLIKNINITQPQYAAKFSQAKIKNVIIFVLESTPAEYITSYNPKYRATPFLDSIKSSAAMFDAIYTHTPATNKAMVSILCGVYPYLSLKSITQEHPDIKWPSISSELKKSGYRTFFFNSGDNSYLGANNFLQNRGFDDIQDFSINPCQADTFSEAYVPNENLEGINDICLPVKLFNQIKSDDSTSFFSMMWTYQTHYPYYITRNSNTIDFYTNNKSLEKYLNALHHADETLKELVEGLKKRNLLNSTLIVVLGDHGEAFGQHGQIVHAGAIFEENIHIPLILINPELFHGEHINLIGGISDVAPTILSILNKPIPKEWQGENLFSTNRRSRVFFFDPFSGYLFGCREGNYKYIYNANKNTSALYDLKNDPYETINIASQQPRYVKEFNKRLSAWIQYQTDYVNSFLK